MKCELCENESEVLYNGWFTVNRCPMTNEARVNQRYTVCESCAKYSIAYKANGAACFAEAAIREEMDYVI